MSCKGTKQQRQYSVFGGEYWLEIMRHVKETLRQRLTDSQHKVAKDELQNVAVQHMYQKLASLGQWCCFGVADRGVVGS